MEIRNSTKQRSTTCSARWAPPPLSESKTEELRSWFEVQDMPKIITRIMALLILLAMFPPLLVALARAKHSDQPRVHLVQDMDNQPKHRAQSASEIFADGRSMRPHV